MKTTQYIPGIMVGVYFLAIVLVYRRLSLVSLMMSAGVGAITHSVTGSLLYASAAALFVLFAMVAIIPREGFLNPMPLNPTVAADAQRILNSTYEPRGFREGFVSSPPEISKRVMNMQTLGFKEGFINIAQNVAKGAFGIMPANDVVEGYEDVKVEKNEIPAPATLKAAVEAAKPKDAMMPFKLGEIPSQVKNGPHIDAGSTLMQAIKGLNPDQINAMTKDTQQLIETQKSLMGMLGTMKPMLNDGKQLMETFQQMFG
jgi:hypothetical protein